MILLFRELFHSCLVFLSYSPLFFPLIYSIWSLDEWRIGKTNFNLPTDWDSRYCKLNVELNELNSGIFLNLDNYADASTIWLGSHFIEIRIVFSGQTTKLCYWIAHFNAHTCESWCLKCLNVHTCCVFSGTFIYIYMPIFLSVKCRSYIFKQFRCCVPLLVVPTAQYCWCSSAIVFVLVLNDRKRFLVTDFVVLVWWNSLFLTMSPSLWLSHNPKYVANMHQCVLNVICVRLCIRNELCVLLIK